MGYLFNYVISIDTIDDNYSILVNHLDDLNDSYFESSVVLKDHREVQLVRSPDLEGIRPVLQMVKVSIDILFVVGVIDIIQQVFY